MKADNVNQHLHDLLVTRDFNPVGRAAGGIKKDVPPAQAVSFSFEYKGQSNKNYGTAVVSIGNEGLTLFFGDNLGKTMESEDKDGWFSFLSQLKNFAIRENIPGGFNAQDLSKLKYTMQGQTALSESWAGTKTQSWNGVETEARLMIKHKRVIGENDARFRYIESLYVETADGERFKLPFTKLSAGRAMIEHVRQGGKPYDLRGNHIGTIVQEMNLLSRFKRANQGRIFEGDTANLVESANVYYEALQHNLKSLCTKTGYTKYFESWDPAEITDEDVIIEDLRHMFVEKNIDSRVEQALPLLAKLQQEQKMKEANIFEQWVNFVVEENDDSKEQKFPESKEQQAELIKLLSTELAVGADGFNVISQLADIFVDDELNEKLKQMAKENPDADARKVIKDRLEELKDNPAIAQVLGQLTKSSDNAGTPPPAAAAPAAPAAATPPPPDQNALSEMTRLAGVTITENIDDKEYSQNGHVIKFSNGEIELDGNPYGTYEKDADNDVVITTKSGKLWRLIGGHEQNFKSFVRRVLDNAGKPKVEKWKPPVQAELSPEEELAKLEVAAANDPYYAMSDDHREWKQGKAREARIAELKKLLATKEDPAALDNAAEYHHHRGYHSDRPDDFEESMMEETGDRSALAGAYGHSGRMQSVEGVDADMMDRIKFLAGITK